MLGWTGGWHVDADHIRLETVDRFLPHSDFFTIDVADSIGQPAAAADVQAFVERHPELIGVIAIAVLFGQRLLPHRTADALPPDLSRYAADLQEHYAIDPSLSRLR